VLDRSIEDGRGDGDMTSLRVIAGSALIFVFSTSHALAATLSFDFSFPNLGNGGGTVTGRVSGLTDNSISAADSVIILSNTLGFGFGEYVGNPLLNSWTVVGGVITNADFLSYGNSNTSPAVTDSTLRISYVLASSSSQWSGLTNNPYYYNTSTPGITFSLVPVPAPAALPLLAFGFGSLGFLGWRRKNKLLRATA
jgi:hypothetical protein